MNLPDGWRVTAYWWSVYRGLPVTLEALRELGSTAAFEAWWAGRARGAHPGRVLARRPHLAR